MSLAEDVDALRRVPMFAQMDMAKLKLLAFTSERMSFPGGAVLFHQDEAADAAFLVLDGEAEVIVAGPEGPVTVAVVGRHGVLGEIALLCDVPRTATVRARTELRTLRIGKDQFFRLLQEFPQLAVVMLRDLALRLEKTTRDLSLVRGAG